MGWELTIIEATVTTLTVRTRRRSEWVAAGQFSSLMNNSILETNDALLNRRIITPSIQPGSAPRLELHVGGSGGTSLGGWPYRFGADAREYMDLRALGQRASAVTSRGRAIGLRG